MKYITMSLTDLALETRKLIIQQNSLYKSSDWAKLPVYAIRSILLFWIPNFSPGSPNPQVTGRNKKVEAKV